jgi:hypothetical protein
MSGNLRASKNNDVDNTTNIKPMLQVHLFDRILKLDANKSLLWNSIDRTKLQEGLLELATIVKRYKADQQAKSWCSRPRRDNTSVWKGKYMVSSTCML